MTTHQKHLLIIDDDIKLLNLLSKYLSKENFLTSTAQNSHEAEKLINNNNYDAIIMDVMMPGENGIDFTKRIRKTNNIPILLLTAMGEVENRIEGLESGANDYLSKPFEPRELILRIENLIPKPEKTLFNSTFKNASFANFSYNITSEILSYNNSATQLTSTENIIIRILAQNINNTISRERISELLNGISERSVDVQINRLRKKLTAISGNNNIITTIRNKGYMIKDTQG